MPKTRSQLSRREYDFVVAFVKTGDRGEAIKAAGYKAKTPKEQSDQGSKLLKKTRIRKAVADLRKEIEEREAKILDLKRGKEWLTRVILGEETTVEMTEGGPVSRPFGDAARVNAFKALAATQGWNAETVKMKHSGKVDAEVKVDAVQVVVPAKLTREEWDRLWGKKEEPKKEGEK